MSTLGAFGHGMDENQSRNIYKNIPIGEGAKVHLGNSYNFSALAEPTIQP
jgi:hypothetical protein